MLTAEIVFGAVVVTICLVSAVSARTDRRDAERARDAARVIQAELTDQQRRARAEAAPVILPFPSPKLRAFDPPRPDAG